MSYYIRLLAPETGVPAGATIQEALNSEGFTTAVAGAPADAAWESLSVEPAGQNPILLRHDLREGEENPVDEEVDNFLDLLLEEPDSPEVSRVEAALRQARQMIVLEVPDEFAWGTGRTVVDALVQFLVEKTGAIIQADGEGFYDQDGNLLLAME